mgnify:CR=1 FL=1
MTVYLILSEIRESSAHHAAAAEELSIQPVDLGTHPPARAGPMAQVVGESPVCGCKVVLVTRYVLRRCIERVQQLTHQQHTVVTAGMKVLQFPRGRGGGVKHVWPPCAADALPGHSCYGGPEIGAARLALMVLSSRHPAECGSTSRTGRAPA